MDRSRITGLALRAGLVGLVVFVAMQLVPYGWEHPNPPVVADAPWPDERSEALARTACYDCHNDEERATLIAALETMSGDDDRDRDDDDGRDRDDDGDSDNSGPG